MTPKTIKQLSLVYGSKGNSDYDLKSDRLVYLKPDSMGESEWEALCADADPNLHVVLSHDQFVEKIRVGLKRTSLNDATDSFLRSLAGWPRGRQRLLSYAYATHLENHEFYQPDIDKNPKYVCEVCGVQQHPVVETTWVLHGLYCGNATNESRVACLVDLEEELTPAGSVDDGRDVLGALLSVIEEMGEDLPPSKVGQAVGKSKVLGKTNKYERISILQTLAVVGVLPNPEMEPWTDRFVTFRELCDVTNRQQGSARSDVLAPLTGWSSGLGIDWSRAKSLFSLEI